MSLCSSTELDLETYRMKRLQNVHEARIARLTKVSFNLSIACALSVLFHKTSIYLILTFSRSTKTATQYGLQGITFLSRIIYIKVSSFRIIYIKVFKGLMKVFTSPAYFKLPYLSIKYYINALAAQQLN